MGIEIPKMDTKRMKPREAKYNVVVLKHALTSCLQHKPEAQATSFVDPLLSGAEPVGSSGYGSREGCRGQL